MDSAFIRLSEKLTRSGLEAECGRCAKAIVLSESVALCRVLGGPMLYVDPRDTSLAPHLMFDGFWESWVTVAIRNHVKPGMHCIDVGANVGYFSVLMAEAVGAAGSVTAFEPQPHLASLVERSLRLSFPGAPHRVECAAAGTENTTGHLYFPPSEDSLGSASLKRHWRESPSQPGVSPMRISVVKLDDVIPPSRKVGFLKIDAEGSEPDVWSGMQRILRDHSPTVAAEFDPKFYDDPDVVLRKFQAAGKNGYVLHVIDHDGRIVPTTEGALLDGPHKVFNMLWLAPRS